MEIVSYRVVFWSLDSASIYIFYVLAASMFAFVIHSDLFELLKSLKIQEIFSQEDVICAFLHGLVCASAFSGTTCLR